MDVYLEVGKKRAFAGALDWPGYVRRGTDETSALEALVGAAPRYARALRGTRLGFDRPSDVSSLRVVERLPGDATTDFGAPGAAPSVDGKPVGAAELRRFGTILRSTWRAFDRAVESAKGRRLRTGPRGGGRSLDKIVEHLIDADGGYLNALGWKHRGTDRNRAPRLDATRKAILEGLAAAAGGKIPRRGPRGGVRWSPRYFVRRVAWHALDHAWEIEDRAI
jgi:DinB family protein